MIWIAFDSSFTPGSWIKMLFPCREMSGSATPRPSTRCRMMSTALSIEPLSGLPFAVSTTEIPPWRSRPSFGVHGWVQCFFSVPDGVGVAVGDALGDVEAVGVGVGDVIWVATGVGLG